jgi:hypothetical protein
MLVEFEYNQAASFYGIGERRTDFSLSDKNWWEHSFWTHDGPFLKSIQIDLY